MKTKKDRDSLKEKVDNIDRDVDEEITKKRKLVLSFNEEIEKLQQKAEYIKVDQIELNKEYEYLQKRNEKLEGQVLFAEERARYKKSSE